MDIYQKLYPLYLEQFKELTAFIRGYHHEHTESGMQTGLSSGDPDVLRIIESIAFFSARTYDASIRNIKQTRNRLYRELFPFLMSPLPELSIMRAIPNGGFTETAYFQKGTEFEFRTDDNTLFTFETMRSFYALPMVISKVQLLPCAENESRLAIDFTCYHTLHSIPSPFSIFFDYIGDTSVSFDIYGFFAEKNYAIKMQLNPLDNENEDKNEWIDLEMPTFGMAPLSIEDDDFFHLLENERLFFKDPRQDLFMHLKMPSKMDSFKSLRLVFDFSQTWPKSILPSIELFHLFCIPVVNVKRDMASPVVSKGTKSTYNVIHSKVQMEFQLCKVIAAYRMLDKGMQPLNPGILADENGTYEIEYVDTFDNKTHVLLHLNSPQSFENPEVVCVDALWFQPHFTLYSDRNFRIAPYSKRVNGLEWEKIGQPIKRKSVNKNKKKFNEYEDVYLNFLAISHKRFYSASDMVNIMDALGPLDFGPFSVFYNSFIDVKYEIRSVDGNVLTAGYIVYYMVFDWNKFDKDSMLFKVFIKHFENVLNYWSNDKIVKLALAPDNFSREWEV
jgi:type VI secretion system protein ImpG